MIKEKYALTLQEAKEILEQAEETDKIKDIKAYIKEFSEGDIKRAKKLREELSKLDIIKLKESDIIKIVDLIPENAAELNKIVTESSLDADETNKILETIKNSK